MSKSTPSLLALLGLVAVAGYQNRDRISDMLADARQKTGAPSPVAGDDLVAQAQHFLQNNPVSTALRDLVGRFQSGGQGDAAESWVSDRANMPMSVETLETVLGPEVLAELVQKTGLSRPELLLRLNVALPAVVNRLTPQGRLPTDLEAQTLA